MTAKRGHRNEELASGSRLDRGRVQRAFDGLQNMTDRIGALGGELGIEASPGNGTRIAGTIPLAGR